MIRLISTDATLGPTQGLRAAVPGASAALLAVLLAVSIPRFGAANAVAVGAAAGVLLFATFACARAPHAYLAALVPVFVLLPTLKVLVFPGIAPLKDLLIVAACLGTIWLALNHGTRPDGAIAGLCAVLILAYALNPFGAHNIAWLHGVRLIAEPLALLLVGLSMPLPKRALKWVAYSLAGTTAALALWGFAQQVVGPSRLVSFGYSYGLEVRTIGGTLRSFGTLDEPFSYASVLLIGFAIALFYLPRGAARNVLLAALLAGLAVSFVRTAGVIILLVVALWLARGRANGKSTLLLLTALAMVVAFLFIQASAPEDTAPGGNESAPIGLNGRGEAWATALGDGGTWAVGRGVGTFGAAAARAASHPSERVAQSSVASVDSMYFAVVADVGLIGLMLLLLLLARLITLVLRRLRVVRKRPPREAWLALSLLVVIAADGLTRPSLTAFPAGGLTLLATGLAIAATPLQATKSRRQRVTSSHNS